MIRPIRTVLWLGVLGSLVLVLQLLLVANAGTDIPFQDQWGVEGAWLYPVWVDGSFRFADLVRPFNEHRIVWTHLLNLTLFAANRQWDPLIQLAAIAVLRSLWVVGLAAAIGRGKSWRERMVIAAVLAVAFMPQLAWHNVLWGFESQVYFALIFSSGALLLLGEARRTARRTIIGIAAGVAALFAMAPAALVPFALLGLWIVRCVEARKVDRSTGRHVWPALALLALAWMLHPTVPEHASLQPADPAEFIGSLTRLLAWPHVEQPIAAVALNVPLMLLIGTRLMKRRVAVQGEDFVLLHAMWALMIAGATAWARGGGAEMSAGVPSRYVDFIILLPLANVWSAIILAREQSAARRSVAKLMAAAWLAFLLVGWAGLSAQMWRNIIAPRMRDQGAPVRLVQAFQESGNPHVFEGQPRLLVPHPNLDVVDRVLRDPRLRGKLPPSLQRDEPIGPVSRAIRWLLRFSKHSDYASG